MNETSVWAWGALLLLGAYHGINPGNGWLFAVALGMQEKSSRAVWRSLAPIATGHALAIGAVVLVAALLGMALPLSILKLVVAGVLFSLGIYRLVRFRDLTIWSFLMASAHGAGLMVLPILLKASPTAHPAGGHFGAHPGHPAVLGSTGTNLLAVTVHTAGYLIVTAAVAWVVYKKVGLALLRKAWLNLDQIWCFTLIVTGYLVLIV